MQNKGILFYAYYADANKKDYYVKYTIPAYMIGSYMSDGYEFDNIDELEKYITKEEWILYYDKYWADSLSRKWFLLDKVENMEKYDLGPVFIRTNLKMLLDNPFKYIVELSHIDSLLFEISTPIDGYDWAPVKNHSGQYDQINELSSNNLFHITTNAIENFTGKLEVIKDILWRGGFYQFVYLIYIGMMILDKNKKKVLILIPIIITNLLLYISMPSQDPRFILPMIIIYPLVTVLTFTKKDKIK